MTGKELFSKYGIILDILLDIVKVLPRKLRWSLFEAHRNTNGKRGLVVRYILLSSLAKSIGSNVSVFPRCYFKYVENLKVGNNVSFQPMCFIGDAGGIEIGNNVSIAHGSTILSSSHTFEQFDKPIKYQDIELKQTIIGNDIWLGCNTVVLAGVQIENGCVIGANSTVTKSIPEYSIAVGSPAKVIKNRGGGDIHDNI